VDGVRLGVLGGTFDPIHLGHLILGEEARVQFNLDRVLFIPAGAPWRKAGRYVSPSKHRLAMTEIAIADNPHFGISRIEIDRKGPSYTVETLAALQEEYGPDTKLFFILGSDALGDLPFWREPKRILAQADLIVAERWGWTRQEHPELEPEISAMGGRIAHLDMPLIAISATRLRERLAAGRSVRYQVPDAVIDYILANDLYKHLLSLERTTRHVANNQMIDEETRGEVV
jgi:nicotinate-nucleotide adenylyltransferase